MESCLFLECSDAACYFQIITEGNQISRSIPPFNAAAERDIWFSIRYLASSTTTGWVGGAGAAGGGGAGGFTAK